MKKTLTLEEGEGKDAEDELSGEEQNGSLSEYEDGLDGLLRHRTAIDNYFNQGRFKSCHGNNCAQRKK